MRASKLTTLAVALAVIMPPICAFAGGLSNPPPTVAAGPSISSLGVNTGGYLIVTMSDGTTYQTPQRVAPDLSGYAMTSDSRFTLASTAVQPGALGTAAYQPTSAFATAAQGALAASAVQPTTAATTAMTGVIKQATALSNSGGSQITGSSGGTVGTVLTSIGTLFSQTAIANNFAALQSQVNAQQAQQAELIANLKGSGALHP